MSEENCAECFCRRSGACFCRKLALPILAVVVFAALLFALALFLDRPLSEFARTLNYPPYSGFFETMTEFGDSKWYLWPTGLGGILCFVLGRWFVRAESRRVVTLSLALVQLYLFAVVAVSGIFAQIVKHILCRARPVLFEREGVFGIFPFSNGGGKFVSFPSGHSVTAMALAVAVAFFIPRWRLPLVLLALMVGCSRILLNAHYLSDVTAGLALGAITAYWLRDVFAKRGLVFVPEDDGRIRVALPGITKG